MNKFELKNLSTKEKIGQLIMAGFHGTEVNDDVRMLIRDYKVGNIILFARNIVSPKQLFELNKELQKIAMEEIGIPLYISIDQEGGMVSRIQDGATFFPGAMTIAATNKLAYAYQVGDLMGKELINLGVNMDLAPILDINNNPRNPVIGVRSYADTPELVSLYANATIKGLQNSIVATAKHFPGHGDTTVDSHLGLPTVTKTRSELEKFEFKPFRSAINEGVQAIMSAHINFTDLTEGVPATLSKKVLTDLLRGEMGFDGLIVTDALEMKAIDTHYGAVEASLMTLNAGANLLCICHDLPYQTGAADRIEKALATGELTMETLDERVERILRYKKMLKPIDFNVTYEDVKALVENDETKALAAKICEEAVTLIKGEPIKLSNNALLVTTLPKATTIADDTDGGSTLTRKVKKEIPFLDILEIAVSPTDAEMEEVIEKAKGYDQVIYTTYNGNVYQSQINLVDKLATLNKDLHILALRNPYDLYYTKAIKNYVAFYEYTPNSNDAVIKYLKGELIPTGKAPIKYE
ncbi:beta-N-acetylhexosaminidase [Acholeplasma hippikon]|uniref:Beta-hexosaminidase n=1 Tax=Acholeplasma hippikon TaxID=264636 RepID=A0A449BK79_9MOLU|nr:beta-N-acetylhexosaminidase [Acholeplasma hippikon]VEU82803.1 beta-hexosaminidase [Acholeplasma hippikon]